MPAQHLLPRAQELTAQLEGKANASDQDENTIVIDSADGRQITAAEPTSFPSLPPPAPPPSPPPDSPAAAEDDDTFIVPDNDPTVDPSGQGSSDIGGLSQASIARPRANASPSARDTFRTILTRDDVY